MEMESFDTTGRFMDDLLDFSSDIGEEKDDEDTKHRKPLPNLKRNTHATAPFNVLEPFDPARSLPEIVEEELEWLSNKDAFPVVETFVDILSEHPGSLAKHNSPVSVLENSTTSSNSNSNSNGNITNGSSNIMSYCSGVHIPVRARSKRYTRRRQDLLNEKFLCAGRQIGKNVKTGVTVSTVGWKCQHCGAEKTPQWRAGPMGPKTLCNACGVRYKSGRLVPEYRPASSPTFSSELHSNSHRKVIEMRKRKQVMGLFKHMVKG
ncbi:GATA transcription factor 1 [Tripterygium wilfordii]|uniref:GATA transcription factor 1 n=1 Tax=Tripterygium wilfordii TaxID=458696 RepID=A0A7J7CXB3_TRIWF|nr:GATA transcription factor 1-like [Tripterygium wilfordii]KAF5738526.1 GATA transcription factor 1 [Tripterygium wilfordii]